MIHPLMQEALTPQELRKRTVYRDVALNIPTIGHMLYLERICPEGIRSEEDFALAALILSMRYEEAKAALSRGDANLKRCIAIAPKTEAERLSLLDHLASAWRAPERFRDPERGCGQSLPHPAANEYASTAALRLLLRVASIPGIGHILYGHPIHALPIQDALALIIADDELHGAHYLSADTQHRLTRPAR